MASLLVAVGAAVSFPTAADATTPAKPRVTSLTASDTGSALVTARVRKQRSEVLSARSEASTTFVNPDGSMTSELFGAPVRVRDRNGKDGWSDVDLTLVERSDGSVGPRVHPQRLTLAGSTTLSGGLLASLTDDGGRRVELGWAGTLPQPTLDGARATYAGVGSGVDLVQEVTRTGIEQFLVLKDRAAADAAVHAAQKSGGKYELRLPVKTQGLVAKAHSGGGIDFLDSKGKVAQTVVAPRMWDAANAAKAGMPANERAVSMRFEVRGGKGQGELVVGADAAWLADPARVFPITIDPTTTLAAQRDTWVQQGSGSPMLGSTELRVGTDGTSVTRSFLEWSASAFTGAKVTSATLSLWQFGAASCTPSSMDVHDAGLSDASTTWANQPAAGALWAQPSFAKGFSGSCAAGWVDVPVTEMAQVWADTTGTTSFGMRLTASETDPAGFKRFNSSSAATNVPKLAVTYNRYPTVAGPLNHLPGQSSSSSTAPGWSNSAAPTLRAWVSDPDGGLVKGLFSVYLNGTGTPVVDRAAGSTVTSGGFSEYTVPAGLLANGSRYQVHVWASDGSLTNPKDAGTKPAAYDTFVVDTVAPAAPTVTSTANPENSWSTALDVDGKITFTATGTSTDNASIQYWLDATGTPSTVSAAPNTTVAISLDPPAAGKHTLYVRSIDKVGNMTDRAPYVFYFGDGAALAQPTANQVTARRVPLQLDVDSARTAGLGSQSVEYRRGSADPWAPVPLAHVTDTIGNPLTAWPTSASSGTPQRVWYWDAAATLGGGGTVEVRAKFSGSPSTTEARTVTIDVDAGQAATSAAGPGVVNLLTGEFSLDSTDASLFGASIGRSYGSRALTAGTEGDQGGAFGPQWSLSGVSAYTAATWQAVRQTSSTSVEVLDANGSRTAFTQKPGSPAAWAPQPGSEFLSLSGVLSASGTLTLKDLDGNVSTFAKPAANGNVQPPADTWPVATTTPAGDDAATRFGFLTDTGGKLRLARLAAPNPALTAAQLQTCVAPTTDLSDPARRGCRVLDVVWSDPDATGPVQDRVTALTSWAWDPVNSAMTQVTEATYTYDASGRLTGVTDPKPALVPGGAALTTTYGYDSNNLLTTLTAPGRLPWTFGYATVGTVAGPTWDRNLPTSIGRLVTLSHPTLAPGSANTTNGAATKAIVYGVPITNSRGPLTITQTVTWGQETGPIEGTTIFDADAPAQPAGDHWAGDDTSKREWLMAQTTYMDVSGRAVNRLGRDGSIDGSQYDASGNLVFEITSGNRALAMGTATDGAASLAELGLSTLSTSARARALATITAYQNGTNGAPRVAWTQGPLHTVITASGALAQQRTTSRYAYDEGRPSGAATSDLVTSTTTGGLPVGGDAATATLDNPRTQTTRYDWAVGAPTATTTDPTPAADDEITTRTTYDTLGRVASQMQPSDPGGSGAGTRFNAYWDRNIGTCLNHPEWGGLPCRSNYLAAITGSTSNTGLPVTTTTYSRSGATASVTETANSVTRTTTITQDQAGRTKTITTTASGLGTVPAAQTLTYDPATGHPATISAGGKTITATTDQLGRDLTYTDSTGLKTSYEYDTLDRPTKRTQTDTALGGLPRTFATTMGYHYYNGRLTTQSDPQTGSTSLGYDTAGNLTSQTHSAAAAGGLRVGSRFDTTGDEVSRAWTMTGQPDPVLTETAVSNIHGQQTDHSMMPGGHRDYRYDGTGRLTSVTDRDAGQCTTRAYRFDVNSNRTGFASTTAAATNDTAGNPTVCPTPATPPVTATFDTGDRITTPGYSYDEHGRTTRLPLGGEGVMRVAYHANDLVAAQTTYATAADADADANNGTGINPTNASTYTLDITGQRIATRTAQATSGTLTQTNRYGDGGDSPAWTNEGNGTTTRTIPGATGDLAAIATLTHTDTTGTGDQVTWQLTDLHGDVSATLPGNAALPMELNRTDEYGAAPTAGSTERYGWLGAKQRAADTPGGIILMGVRLYNPTTGRFLSTDPVYGGNANTYTYPVDPVGRSDTSGQFSCTTSSLGWGRSKSTCTLSHFETDMVAVFGTGALTATVKSSIRHWAAALAWLGTFAIWYTAYQAEKYGGRLAFSFYYYGHFGMRQLYWATVWRTRY